MSEEPEVTGSALEKRDEEVDYVNEHEVRKAASTKLAPLALRHAGYTYEEIARLQALPDAMAAKRAVDEALALHLASDPQSRELSRALFDTKLTAMTKALWPKVMNPKHAEQIQAGRLVLQIIEAQTKLVGANAPTEHHISSPSYDRLEQIVAELSQRVGEAEEKDIFADAVDAEVIEESA